MTFENNNLTQTINNCRKPISGQLNKEPRNNIIHFDMLAIPLPRNVDTMTIVDAAFRLVDLI